MGAIKDSETLAFGTQKGRFTENLAIVYDSEVSVRHDKHGVSLRAWVVDISNHFYQHRSVEVE